MAMLTVLRGNPAIPSVMTLMEIYRLSHKGKIEVREDRSLFSVWRLLDGLKKYAGDESMSCAGFLLVAWGWLNRNIKCRMTVTNPLKERIFNVPRTVDHAKSVDKGQHDTVIRLLANDAPAIKAEGTDSDPVSAPAPKPDDKAVWLSSSEEHEARIDYMIAALDLPGWNLILRHDRDAWSGPPRWTMPVSSWPTQQRNPRKLDGIKDLEEYRWQWRLMLGTFHDNTARNHYDIARLLAVLKKINQDFPRFSDREVITVIHALCDDLKRGGWLDPELGDRLGDHADAKLCLLGMLRTELGYVLHDVRRPRYALKPYRFFATAVDKDGRKLNKLIEDLASVPRGDPKWLALYRALESHRDRLAAHCCETIDMIVTWDLMKSVREKLLLETV